MPASTAAIRSPRDPAAVAKDWDDILSINLDGMFNVTRAFLDQLRATKGRIVNIGSIQSFVHVELAELGRLHDLQARRAGLHPRAGGGARQGRRAGQRHRARA